jgi:uncharacterized protein
MVWTIHYELTQSQIISKLGYLFLILSIFFLLGIILRRVGFFRKIRNKIKIKKKATEKILFGFMILFLLLFLLFFFLGMKLDLQTSVKVHEKILIIELDDWWNIQNSSDYLGQFGYTLERYKQVTDIIDKYGFVATIGVTPYIFIEETGENIPLRDDSEMMKYIEEVSDKGYEIGMHGYNHCRNSFYCPAYEEIWYNVFEGKKEIEDLFGKSIYSYFPPGNAWTTEQYENVKRAGFVIIGNTHVPRAYFDENVIITPKGYDPIYYYGWYQLDFRHTPYEDWIKAYKKDNLFILQLHQNTFDSEEKLEDLDNFLSYVKEDGAKSMTYKEFYDYIKEEKDKNAITGKAIIEF